MVLEDSVQEEDSAQEVAEDSVQEVVEDSAQVVLEAASVAAHSVDHHLVVVVVTLPPLDPVAFHPAMALPQPPMEDHTKSCSVYEISSAIDPASAEPMVLLLSFWANISPALYYILYKAVLGLVYSVFFSNQKTRWQ